MLIDVKVSARSDGEVETAMTRDLLEHVIEKSQSGGDARNATAIEVQLDCDVGFEGCAFHAGTSRPQGQETVDLIPRSGDQIGLAAAAFTDENGLRPEVFGQFDIGLAVANDERRRQIVRAVDVLLKHPRAGFARGQVLGRKAAVNQHLAEQDTLVGKGLDDFGVRRPEAVFREGWRSQTVLVGHHHQFVIELFGDARQRREDARDKTQFFKRIDLLIDGRFNH